MGESYYRSDGSVNTDSGAFKSLPRSVQEREKQKGEVVRDIVKSNPNVTPKQAELYLRRGGTVEYLPADNGVKIVQGAQSTETVIQVQKDQARSVAQKILALQALVNQGFMSPAMKKRTEEQIKELRKEVTGPVSATTTIGGVVKITGEVTPPAPPDPWIREIDGVTLEKPVKRKATELTDREKWLIKLEDQAIKTEKEKIQSMRDELDAKYYETTTKLVPTIPGGTAIPTETRKKKETSVFIGGFEFQPNLFGYEKKLQSDQMQKDLKKIEARESAFIKKYYPLADLKDFDPGIKVTADIPSATRQNLTDKAIVATEQLPKSERILSSGIATVFGQETAVGKAQSLQSKQLALEAMRTGTTITPEVITERAVFDQLGKKSQATQQQGIQADVIDFTLIAGGVIVGGALIPAVTKVPVLGAVVSNPLVTKGIATAFYSSEAVNVALGAYDLSKGKGQGAERIAGTVTRVGAVSLGTGIFKSPGFQEGYKEFRARVQFPQSSLDYALSSFKRPPKGATYDSSRWGSFQATGQRTLTAEPISNVQIREAYNRAKFPEKFYGKIEQNALFTKVRGLPTGQRTLTKTKVFARDITDPSPFATVIDYPVVVVNNQVYVNKGGRLFEFVPEKYALRTVVSGEVLPFDVKAKLKAQRNILNLPTEQNVLTSPRLRPVMSKDSPFIKQLTANIEAHNAPVPKVTTTKPQPVIITESKVTGKTDVTGTIKTEKVFTTTTGRSSMGGPATSQTSKDVIYTIPPGDDYFAPSVWFDERGITGSPLIDAVKGAPLVDDEIRFTTEIVKPGSSPGIRDIPEIKRKSESGIKPEFITDPINRSKIEPFFMLDDKIGTRSSSRSRSDTIIGPMIDQSQSQDQAQIQEQITDQAQTQEQITDQITTNPLPINPTIDIIRRWDYIGKPPEVPPPTKIPGFQFGFGSKSPLGFSAEVRKGGVFKEIGRFDNPAQAFARAKKEVLGTASASLRVRGPGGFLKGFFNFGKDFRRSEKEEGVIIQKREKRIKSQGELREITFKGLASQRLRKTRSKGGLFSKNRGSAKGGFRL